MPRKIRKRRTADEARAAILDAAEKRLALSGPAGIRLQDVAKDVGVSHPTVLHHFGDRDSLVQAVVDRALDSLHVSLLAALAGSVPGPNQVGELLERVNAALVESGHARAFLWLALAGYRMSADDLRIRSFADVVHEVRRERRKAMKRDVPSYEDTYFSVLLPALALMTLSVIEPQRGSKRDARFDVAHFRAWLAKLVHHHLENAN
jgi:AcrR family transcriptional regulator